MPHRSSHEAGLKLVAHAAGFGRLFGVDGFAGIIRQRIEPIQLTTCALDERERIGASHLVNVFAQLMEGCRHRHTRYSKHECRATAFAAARLASRDEIAVPNHGLGETHVPLYLLATQTHFTTRNSGCAPFHYTTGCEPKAMLRITASTNAEAAKQYFGKGMTRSDYYIDGQEITGQWGGKTAERLGLSGQVDAESYFALCDNLDPRTGEKLSARQKDNRRAGYDFTFSVPKSVSVFYELSQDERILDAFRQSVAETMEDIEREMKTRVRKGGKDENRVTGNIVWAEFVHFTSRPVDGRPDPHLHAHLFVPNISWDEKEQRFKAGQFGELKRDAPFFEAAFDARLAKRLNELGLATERDSYSFEIAGVPNSLIKTFSRRRDDIEAKAAARGIESAQGKHAIAARERENKTKDVGKDELRQEWQARLTPSEWEAVRSVLNGDAKGDRATDAHAAMNYAVEHCFERVSVASEKRLKAEALRFGVGSVLPDAINKAASDMDLIRRERDGETLVTTRAVRKEELQMLRFAREGRGTCKPFGPLPDGPSDLSAEQRKAAAHVLASNDRVVGIRGAAGAGKTHMLKSTIAAIEANASPDANYSKVFVFAPSAQASRGVLKSEGFADATTVAHLLTDSTMQEKVRNQVLLIDEAGLLGSKSTRDLFRLAETHNCRVILSGDYRQHSAVERGDAFRLLQTEAGVSFAELTQIRRQTDSDYRRAVEAISKGTADGVLKGFTQLDDMGAIIEADKAEQHKLLVADYLQAVQDGRSALVIAPTHREGRALTGEIRQALKDKGELGDVERSMMTRTATNWTQAQRSDARNYREGQIVQFHKAVAGKRLQMGGVRGTAGGYQKGEAGVVLRKDGSNVVILRQDGSQALLPLAQAARFNVYNAQELKIAEGEKLRITNNGYAKAAGGSGKKGKRLNNGDIFTVAGFTESGDIQLNNGAVLPKTYGHFAQGYVDTSYASQGKTVDRVFIAVGSDSLPAANRAQWYVSVSRGRELARIYTDDAESLKAAIQKSPDRLSVSEMMRGKALRPRLDMRRIGQYLKNRVQDAYEAVSGRAAWQQRIQRERSGQSYER